MIRGRVDANEVVDCTSSGVSRTLLGCNVDSVLCKMFESQRDFTKVEKSKLLVDRAQNQVVEVVVMAACDVSPSHRMEISPSSSGASSFYYCRYANSFGL